MIFLLKGDIMVDTIDRFDGKYLFLSNFYICDVEYDGIVYPHTEAAFHAQKVFDEETKLKFTNVIPRKSKRLGHKVKLREDWDEVKDNIMYEVCKAKFEQNEDIRKLLLETGDATLIEGNTWNDQYWGVCRGKGRNQLGKTLMRIRDELRE